MIGVLSSPLRTTDIKRCAPLAALWGGMRHWTRLGRHTRRTAHPQPNYSPTPVTAHSGHQRRNGAHTIEKDWCRFRQNTPRIRRRPLRMRYYVLHPRGTRAGESATPPSTQLGARGRAGGIYRLREGRGVRRAINA